jgi:hypothetical protein
MYLLLLGILGSSLPAQSALTLAEATARTALAWGIFGYLGMPKRKDPEIPVRETLAIARWPGMPAERVEELITKPVEEALAKNSKVVEIRSITRDGTAYVYAKLDEELNETARELDDLKLKVGAVQLPEGAEPVDLIKDFGDTATLMLTVASPAVDDADLTLRGQDIAAALRPGSIAILWPHSRTLSGDALAHNTKRMAEWLESQGMLTSPRPLQGSGFTGCLAFELRIESRIGPIVGTALARRRNPSRCVAPNCRVFPF